ncbi:phage terminase large subunit family protein [Luteimonas sp. JM171]|uniref:phage terminase large subunit family protein n=1 Tax=Luteimonas sp. JM171 TaxID=1896164 RepID=UPI0008589D26|nr:phage terminase large subunit family protein [Luteimonas sp. JM171]AOH36870.1 hypothetical protein BGP89_11320 [Luteimonas sp. JM171]
MTLPLPPTTFLEGVPLADGVRTVADAWRRGWTLPDPQTLSAWADEFRKVNRAASDRAGDWETARVPYLRQIMDDLSVESTVRHVDLMKCTQVGGTEVLNNWCGYVIDHAPGPMMVVQPTVEMAERWSKQRLAPMLVDMPCLADKIPPARSRDSGNTTLMKEFPAGFLVITGANSSSGLRSMPVKYLGMDEIDEYEGDLNDQGSALELAERRTSSFFRRKILCISTPTLKGASAIEKRFLLGTQYRYRVPCPHCNGLQLLEIEQLTDDARYLCVLCGTLIDEVAKPGMMAEENGAKWQAGRPEMIGQRHSYHINALYTPLGDGYSWGEIVEMRAEAKRNAEERVTFSNTILGLPFEGATQRVEANELLERREPTWKRRELPPGCLLLTVGIDVQANRWAVLIAGWGRGEACWFVDYVEIPGDPTREEDWAALEEVVFAPLANRYGVQVRASCIAIDSGNWTHEVYGWVRKHQARGVIALKGMRETNKPVIGRPSAQDVNWRGRTIRGGIQLWPAGVNTTKNTLFARLGGDDGLEVDQRRCHFPSDMPADFFDQLTAEVFDLKRKRWVVQNSRRNEAWDCWVYAYTAACHPLVRVHVLREADWAALEAKLEPANRDLFAAADDDDGETTTDEQRTEAAPAKQPAPAPEPAAAPARPARPRGGFATRW